MEINVPVMVTVVALVVINVTHIHYVVVTRANVIVMEIVVDVMPQNVDHIAIIVAVMPHNVDVTDTHVHVILDNVIHIVLRLVVRFVQMIVQVMVFIKSYECNSIFFS